MTQEDRRFMKLALAMGRRGQGSVWPNPAVGCVIVKSGRIVGRGYTQASGRPHAETEALAQAGQAAKGATAYVTLEPCSHTGKTPPCAEALIAAGLARVVTALEDPDPRVSGRGHAMLRAAGITVDTGVLAGEARQDHKGFVNNRSINRPFVTLKLAASLDGRIATASGESQWITGPAARRKVHAMRLCHDAVMIGAGTLRTDDPSLTVRDLGHVRQPARIIVTSNLDIPLTGKLIDTARDPQVYICHADTAPDPKRVALHVKGAKCLSICPSGPVDPRGLMKVLADEGFTRIFCEGGGRLAAALLEADLVDDIAQFSAGLMLGGAGLPMVAPLAPASLAEFPRFELHDVQRFGPDLLHTWRRKTVANG